MSSALFAAQLFHAALHVLERTLHLTDGTAHFLELTFFVSARVGALLGVGGLELFLQGVRRFIHPGSTEAADGVFDVLHFLRGRVVSTFPLGSLAVGRAVFALGSFLVRWAVFAIRFAGALGQLSGLFVELLRFVHTACFLGFAGFLLEVLGALGGFTHLGRWLAPVAAVFAACVAGRLRELFGLAVELLCVFHAALLLGFCGASAEFLDATSAFVGGE